MTGAPNPHTDLIIRPTGLQRTVSYIRTGSLPPVLAVPAITFDAAAAFLASSALCLAAGYLLGSSIAS